MYGFLEKGEKGELPTPVQPLQAHAGAVPHEQRGSQTGELRPNGRTCQPVALKPRAGTASGNQVRLWSSTNDSFPPSYWLFVDVRLLGTKVKCGNTHTTSRGLSLGNQPADRTCQPLAQQPRDDQ